MSLTRGITSDLAVHQGTLENALNTIFPKDRVIKEARRLSSLINPVTGGYLEVDVWYPQLKISFEYQDDYHYRPTWYSHFPLSYIQTKDNAKRDLLLRRGETLIVVPCWWDGTSSSLQETISFHRPDLLHASNIYNNNVIPVNPPFKFFEVSAPLNVQLMLASFPSSTSMVDVSDQNLWWIGEKYDGIRCFWDPQDRQMYTRHGQHIPMHEGVVSGIESAHIVLDGEMWCGRGFFLESQVPVQTADVGVVNWGLLRVICFDEASLQPKDRLFEERYNFILSKFPPDHATVIIASRFLMTQADLLVQLLQQVVSEGAEGVILRKPHSIYFPGRSTSLVKLKASRADQEALVVNVAEDGSLMLQLPDRTSFVVPKEDCVLHRRVVRGDVVTFTHDFARRTSAAQGDAGLVNLTVSTRRTAKHDEDTREGQGYEAQKQDLLRGMPSNPIVSRIRDDMSWEDVVNNSSSPVRHFLNEPHQHLDSVKKPSGYWSYDRGKNMRAHFEAIARMNAFDPLVADNWYHLPRHKITEQREVRTVLKYYGSLSSALVNLFPEVQLDLSKFLVLPRGFWRSVQNRRNKYEGYAHAQGRNPLDTKFWYSLKNKDTKELLGPLKYYKGDLAESVQHLFPELHLDRRKFERHAEASRRDKQYLMTASFLSSSSMVQVDPQNKWWLCESYDGVRCFWKSNEKQMYSKRGHKIGVHPSLVNLFGHIDLDGEIWCGRGLFLESPMLNQLPLSKVDWGLWRVVCFDAPSHQIKAKLFERRYSLIMSQFPAEHPVVIIAAYLLCKSSTSLTYLLREVVTGAGDGVLLRKPRSTYQLGRSPLFLMLKASRVDQEALVLNVEKAGSLLLQLPDGSSFVVPRTNCILQGHVAPGDVVTFTRTFALQCHHRATHGGEQTEDIVPTEGVLQSSQGTTATRMHDVSPSDPVVYQLRDDLSWEYLVRRSSHINLVLDETHHQLSAITRLYQSNDDHNWTRALVHWFPALNLEASDYNSTPRNFWTHVENRRALTEKFAYSRGGDPLNPTFWYSMRRFHSFKGMQVLMEYYEGHREALLHLFPELGLDQRKFAAPSWTLTKQRREFFDKFASAQGFNPLVPAHWYHVSSLTISRFQGYRAIVKYYNGQLPDCLMHLYPNIGMQKSKFSDSTHWHSPKYRRAALIGYAAWCNFDPFDARNWYSLSLADYNSYYETASMLQHYRGDYVIALTSLFPDVTFERGQFTLVPTGHWEDVQNRRELFCEVALRRRFDPLVPANWYQTSLDSLSNVKGVNSIVTHYYNGSLSKALAHIFADIHLVEAQFHQYDGREWDDKNNLKWYLGSVAKKNRFDPQQASQWMSFLNTQKPPHHLNKIFKRLLLKYDSIPTALVDIFHGFGPHTKE